MDLFEKAFHETITALGQENLNNLIIVGGWCPYLYAQYIWKRAISDYVSVGVYCGQRSSHSTSDKRQ